MRWRSSFRTNIVTGTDLDAILRIAAALGIPLDEAYRDGVITNYERLLQQAALVMAVPLPETPAGPMEFEP
jgi:1-carboxybiuret hydrolase subunit AtzG-like